MLNDWKIEVEAFPGLVSNATFTNSAIIYTRPLNTNIVTGGKAGQNEIVLKQCGGDSMLVSGLQVAVDGVNQTISTNLTTFSFGDEITIHLTKTLVTGETMTVSYIPTSQMLVNGTILNS